MRGPALHDSQRATLFHWGALAVLAACALAPLLGRTALGSDYSSHAITEGLSNAPYAPFVRRIAARRDPFVPEAVDLPSGAIVQAVILSDRPRALVQFGGKGIIVVVGDVLEGMRVTAIDERGVWLADGARIPVASQ